MISCLFFLFENIGRPGHIKTVFYLSAYYLAGLGRFKIVHIICYLCGRGDNMPASVEELAKLDPPHMLPLAELTLL